MNDLTPSPEDVFLRIASEHQRIRSALDTIEAVLPRVSRGEQAAVAALSAHFERLHRLILSHMEMEAQLLAPTLNKPNGNGASGARRLIKHHAAQKLDLDELVHCLTSRTGNGNAHGNGWSGWTVALRSILDGLRTDIEEEEQELLSSS